MGVSFSEKLRSVFGLIWGLYPLSVEKTHLLTGGYGGRKGGKLGGGKERNIHTHKDSNPSIYYYKTVVGLLLLSHLKLNVFGS
jgi:hypothetical protein